MPESTVQEDSPGKIGIALAHFVSRTPLGKPRWKSSHLCGGELTETRAQE
jgi:hypothetical protein